MMYLFILLTFLLSFEAIGSVSCGKAIKSPFQAHDITPKIESVK